MAALGGEGGRSDDGDCPWLLSKLEDSSGHTRACPKKLMPGWDAPVVGPMGVLGPMSCGYPLPTFLSGKADLKGICDHGVSYA